MPGQIPIPAKAGNFWRSCVAKSDRFARAPQQPHLRRSGSGYYRPSQRMHGSQPPAPHVMCTCFTSPTFFRCLHLCSLPIEYYPLLSVTLTCGCLPHYIKI
jgi:hypothetical protein